MSLSVLFKYSLHFGKKEKYAFYQLSFRYGVSFKNISGESKSVTAEMTAPWTETKLPTILSRYPLENIFNAYEFGLLYQCLPNKTLHLKEEKCSRGKHSKIRLTGLVAGNACCERLPMFGIGKANKPRCFKSIRNIPIRYRAQRKSWMTAELFEEWVRQLDRKFSAVNRKITLIIDNCTAHLHVEQLNSIELIFLPPNTTSNTQLMDFNWRFKSQVSLIDRSKTDRSIRKAKSSTNHINFIRYDDAGKGVKCCFEQNFH